MSWVAYVDESMRQRHDGDGLYVMAAAVFDPADADELRLAASQLTRGRRRFHWRYEEPADQRKAVSVVASLDALHLVVVGIGLQNVKQERGRRQCLTRLLIELEQAQVTEVRLDSRRSNQNVEDLRLVAALRARRLLGSVLRVNHVLAEQDPLEWLPDIVAGAVSGALGEGELGHLVALERVLMQEPIMLELD